MIHPEFHQAVIEERRRGGLEQRRHRREVPAVGETPAAEEGEQVVLRLSSVRDAAGIGRLAELEGRPAPGGRFVVAEVDGVVVAALPLARGVSLADPFRATAHLFPLLAVRARQVSARPAAQSGLLLGRRWSRA